MKKKEKEKSTSKIYFFLLLALSLLIISEAVSVINVLASRERRTQNLLIKKITPTPKQTEFRGGSIKITLEENQKIAPAKDIKAKIKFNSPFEPIGGVDVVLTFDPKLVTIVRISGNNEIFNQIIINKQKEKEGKIKITAYQPTKTLQGEQVLADLTFRILEKKQTILKIEFLGPEIATDSNLVSQNSGKDILREVNFLNLALEGER